MNLPDIALAPKYSREVYFSLLTHMAHVDENLDESEVELLKSEAKRLGLNESDAKTIMARGKMDESEVDRGFDAIRKERMEYSFLLDLIFMAMADGFLHDNERVYLAKINDRVAVSRADFHSLVYFAQSSLGVKSPDEIDPMVEYMIENFFRWARQDHVRLYRQTTFALNEEVDLFLKNEL